MAVPKVIYTFDVYQGTTFLTRLKWKAPYRRATNAERYHVTDGADLLDGTNSVFGEFMPILYRDLRLPGGSYLPISIAEACEMIQTGFNVSTYASVGTVLTFYINKDENFGLEWKVWDGNPNDYEGVRIFRGTWYSNWVAYYGWHCEYRNQWGHYYGFYSGCGLPLPDWERIANAPDTDTTGLIYPSYSCNGYYTTSTSLPSVHPEQGTVETQNTGTLTIAQIKTWLGQYQPDIPDDENPYWDGGISEPGGGETGNFSEDSDTVTEDPMPTLSAIGTGMATIFNPDATQLKDLSDVFWGSNWWQALQNSVEGIDKMFVSLGIVPFEVTAGSTVEVTWLGLSVTEVRLTLAAQQYYEFDMGTIDLSDDDRIFTSDSALDYSPFSKLGIYLPFIGYQELDIDECRNATINLKYRVDILSGTCVALIKVAGSTIYQFTGNCITQIPITSQSFENLFTNAVNVGIAWGNARNAGAIAGGGDAGDPISPVANMKFPKPEIADGEIGAQSRLGNATANAMMGLKPTFNKTGSVSASATLFTVKQPFLFLSTPRQCLPEHYQRYCGFPSNITGKLSSFSGLTVVESIRLNNLVATATEVQEIYDLLRKGVII